MKCKCCGKELHPDAKFCTNCGAAADQTEHTENLADIKEIYQEEKTVENLEIEEMEMPDSSDNEKRKSFLEGFRQKWNDRYTILLLAGILIVAALAGVGVKKYKDSQEITANQNDSTLDSFEEDEEIMENSADTEYTDDDGDDNDISEDEEDGMELYGKEDGHEEYILPGSDKSYLTMSDLDGMTAEECRLARNELYARHGRIFKDEELQRYFESFDWYHPSIQPDDFQESMLNAYETANRDLIVEYEENQGYR